MGIPTSRVRNRTRMTRKKRIYTDKKCRAEIILVKVSESRVFTQSESNHTIENTDQTDSADLHGYEMKVRDNIGHGKRVSRVYTKRVEPHHREHGSDGFGGFTRIRNVGPR
jgi:hypothetical protein